MITEYVYEDKSVKNKDVPELFKNPSLSLIANQPEIAILGMTESSKKYFLAKDFLNLTDLGTGVSYETEKTEWAKKNLLDVFSASDVIFGVKHSGKYASTIKTYCLEIRKIDYLRTMIIELWNGCSGQVQLTKIKVPR